MTGPIHFDCTAQSAVGAVRKLDDTLRRMRAGPRLFVIRVATDEVLEAATRWASAGQARHDVREGPAGVEVHVYLLPLHFGGHPALPFVRPALDRAVAGRAPQRASADGLAELGPSL